MTVEADITTVLRTVCDRVSPDFAPVNTVRPYVTFQCIGGDAVTYLGREVPSKQNQIFQVNVWAATRASAATLALAIESAMTLATTFQAKPMGAPVADFDSDVPVYGSAQDFDVWSDR